MDATAILVMAKAPVPGRVKTRLAPPCTAQQCAEVAAAALADTLEASRASGRRVVLALDGHPGNWLPPGVEVMPQHGEGLAERLTLAWAHLPGGGVQIGMDTPQVTAAALLDALARLETAPSALGLAADGGWWAIALRRPHARVFTGVPMSTASTGRRQRERLVRLGLRPVDLPVVADVDEWPAARAVAAAAPHTRMAAVVRAIDRGLQPGPPETGVAGAGLGAHTEGDAGGIDRRPERQGSR